MRRVSYVFLATVLLAALTGCGGADRSKAVDLIALAADLTGSGVYSDILNPPFEDAEVVATLYDLAPTDVTTGIVRCSTGATAEELALFQAADEDAAARIEMAMQTRVQRQIAAFARYVPEEVPKLEQALVQRSGVYVALVVAAQSDGADKILYNYFYATRV